MLPGIEDIDRSSMNAWDDAKLRAAVDATGRERLVMCGISTSACLAYPVVDALADGREVCFVEDAVGEFIRSSTAPPCCGWRTRAPSPTRRSA